MQAAQQIRRARTTLCFILVEGFRQGQVCQGEAQTPWGWLGGLAERGGGSRQNDGDSVSRGDEGTGAGAEEAEGVVINDHLLVRTVQGRISTGVPSGTIR